MKLRAAERGRKNKYKNEEIRLEEVYRDSIRTMQSKQARCIK